MIAFIFFSLLLNILDYELKSFLSFIAKKLKYTMKKHEEC